MDLPKNGLTIQELVKRSPGLSEEAVLKKVADAVAAGQAHMHGDLIFPGRAKPGRPALSYGDRRKTITIRLPAELADWLRQRKNYTRFIENFVRVERQKALKNERLFKPME